MGNSFAIDETGGVYIVTDAAEYRFDTGPTAVPRSPGASRTPTAASSSPADRARLGHHADAHGVRPARDHRQRRPDERRRDAARQELSGKRTVCSVPVFEKGASATDNSLITDGSSLVVENNYGYNGPSKTEQGGTTTPGLARVDVDRRTGTCKQSWLSKEIAPLGRAQALARQRAGLHVHEGPQPDDQDAWYLTTLDFRTGKTVYKRLAGEGLGFNNNYAPVTIGPTARRTSACSAAWSRCATRTPPPQGLAPGRAARRPACAPASASRSAASAASRGSAARTGAWRAR
jgi:hypothetical protein